MSLDQGEEKQTEIPKRGGERQMTVTRPVIKTGRIKSKGANVNLVAMQGSLSSVFKCAGQICWVTWKFVRTGWLDMPVSFNVHFIPQFQV